MKCDYDYCKNCNKNNNCTLQHPTNKEHLLLNNEINYWLNELKQAKRRIKQYREVFNDILTHKYCFTVNVYGNIQYAPKQNALGVTIRRPEHVYYGWNLNRLKKKEAELIEKIKELRLNEFELRRELS